MTDIKPIYDSSGRPGMAPGEKSLAPLSLSSMCRVWGASGAPGIRPTTGNETFASKHTVPIGKAQACRFCGFCSIHNEVHHANDNHSDNQAANLWASDPLCHGWNHLGEWSQKEAVVAYLPGLSAADVNHLQRTVMVALQCDDEAVKRSAMDILNWAASHRDYVGEAWGTYAPDIFSDALSGQTEQIRESREFVFAGLALIYHPRTFATKAAQWASEAYAKNPVRKWRETYHAVMNAPV